MKLLRHLASVMVWVAILAPAPIAVALSIDSVDGYAWGENVGWLNWASSEGAVDVPVATGDLTGYVWGENVGWLSLNCSNTATCGTVDYKVSRGGGEFTGYAWGENVGWVSFSCLNTASCGTVDYRVSIATVSGEFSGYSWGENVGWVVFNCSTTASCGTVDYKVRTATPTPTPTSGGGGGGAFISPSPTPPLPVTPSPLPSAGPTPSGGPLATPPPATPTVGPPSVSPAPPGGGVTGAVDSIAGALDRLLAALFGSPDEPCSELVGFAACASTAIAIAAVAIALIAGLVQGELTASLLALLVVFGLRRKARVWGVVYDSATKHPVPMAKVELLDAAGRMIEGRFADADGRFGFLASPESLGVAELTVKMRASKNGFIFPSKHTVSGTTDYIVYDRLYYGAAVVIRKSEFIAFNIPMDPVSARRVSLSGLGRNLIGVTGDRLLAAGFVIGCVAVPLNLWLNPTPLNWAIAVAFVLANSLRAIGLYRPYGKTTDALTGKALPFALVTMHDPSTAARVGFAVSDEHGRFILSGVRGSDYDLQVYTPANISPQRVARLRVRASSRIGRRGWVTMTIKV